jgi:hypothetical protein
MIYSLFENWQDMFSQGFEVLFHRARAETEIEGHVVHADLFQLLEVSDKRAMARPKPKVDAAGR